MTGSGPTVHASAVRVERSGVLIRGASGSGKSSLALALMMEHRGDVRLVADDRVSLSVSGGRLHAAAPPELAGLIEVRGVGIIARPHLGSVEIDLVVDLLPIAECPRMPEADDAIATLLGVDVPRLALPVGDPYAALRVRVALDHWAT